jgi:hypothetical protein
MINSPREVLIASGSLRAQPECSETFSRGLENAARAALDSLGKRTRTDAEWANARGKPLQFVTILRGWDQKAKNTALRLGHVEALCQREPQLQRQPSRTGRQRVPSRLCCTRGCRARIRRRRASASQRNFACYETTPQAKGSRLLTSSPMSKRPRSQASELFLQQSATEQRRLLQVVVEASRR